MEVSKRMSSKGRPSCMEDKVQEPVSYGPSKRQRDGGEAGDIDHETASTASQASVSFKRLSQWTEPNAGASVGQCSRAVSM